LRKNYATVPGSVVAPSKGRRNRRMRLTGEMIDKLPKAALGIAK
jgi:hypothetical protein